MEQKTDRIYPSAPFENNDSEQRLEKKVCVVKSFINPINSIEEKTIYIKDKNNKPKKN